MDAVVAATSPASPALRYRDGAAALSADQPDALGPPEFSVTTEVADVAADDEVAPPIATPTPDNPDTTRNTVVAAQTALLQWEKRFARLDRFTIRPFERRDDGRR
jgi:hypothetical protein